MQPPEESPQELKEPVQQSILQQSTQPVIPASTLRDQKIDEARNVLRGGDKPSEQLKQLCKELEALDQFAYASEVLNKKIETDKRLGNPVALKEYQTLAKYIYKDNSLPSSFKFDRALHELNSNDDLEKTTKCETLGLAGAIYKYKWQYDHLGKNLLLSQFYYKRGYQLWKNFIAGNKEQRSANADHNDDGYTAINFAYISELIAIDRLEEMGKTTGVDTFIKQQFSHAKETREYIIEQFLAKEKDGSYSPRRAQYDSWVYATIAEAFFGLCNYEEAIKYIGKYVHLKTDNGDDIAQDWQIRTFSKQLFSIAYLQVFQLNFFDRPKREPENENWKLLKEESGKINRQSITKCLVEANSRLTAASTSRTSQIEVKKDGKLGLALSGGGFRASLFHIGVLAALAEKDELRNVEVISCVSGGSIIGAYYYLKLKELLESKEDDEITRADYIKIVQDTEENFLNGVQQNLRIRLFSHLPSNFKMLFDKNYSRTHRMGDLYEKYLFNGLLKNDSNEGTDAGKIYMDQLFIYPKGANNFSITNDNWHRKNKVPQLVLNATSVNTGHNWQFTASWMGEPPGNIQTDIDVKPRLRRMYYKDAPDPYKKFRLGYAVGASSCVPVMFHPMPMNGLYETVDLQLIDGGLHDNQGIAALIEQECRNMIISDASGQLPTSNVAETTAAGLFFRADNILQERLRELQFMDIKERSYTTQLNKLRVVTLKNDLPNDPISWKFCKDPKRKILYAEIKDPDNDLTKYYIQRSIQTHLSEIRTDLDAFNDVEASALMYSGYRQIYYEYSKTEGGTPSEPCKEDKAQWKFTSIEPFMSVPESAAEIDKILKTAKKQTFKVIDLNTTLRYSLICVGIIALLAVIYMAYMFYYSSITVDLGIKSIVFLAVVFCIGLFSKMLASLLDYKSTIRKYTIYVVMALLLWAATNVYLKFFNGLYLKAGALKRKEND